MGTLRNAAALRDGNKILQVVAQSYAANFTAPGSISQAILTAITQLAVTGSNAFAAWSANPTSDLTSQRRLKRGTTRCQVMDKFRGNSINGPTLAASSFRRLAQSWQRISVSGIVQIQGVMYVAKWEFEVASFAFFF